MASDREALKAIRAGLAADNRESGDFWEARALLDKLGIYHENLSGTRVLLELATAALAAPPSAQEGTFQQRVNPWLQVCFGPEISADHIERNHRFLEEALELVQAHACTQDEAHQLVDYVFTRKAGDPGQEAGGVMVTLAALCLANGLDMHGCGEVELARIWTKVDAIRAKQAAKPKHSPLPSPLPPPPAGAPRT